MYCNASKFVHLASLKEIGEVHSMQSAQNKKLTVKVTLFYKRQKILMLHNLTNKLFVNYITVTTFPWFWYFWIQIEVLKNNIDF